MDLERLKADLRRDEGLRLLAYKCPAGVWTIGYGHTGHEVLEGMAIDHDLAETYLARDIAGVFHDLDRNVPWWRDMPEPAARGLCNMGFNLGWTRLSGFKMMLHALEAGAWETAAREGIHSKWAEQVGARATRIAELYREAGGGRQEQS